MQSSANPNSTKMNAMPQYQQQQPTQQPVDPMFVLNSNLFNLSYQSQTIIGMFNYVIANNEKQEQRLQELTIEMSKLNSQMGQVKALLSRIVDNTESMTRLQSEMVKIFAEDPPQLEPIPPLESNSDN
jgi:hypothetical protein